MSATTTEDSSAFITEGFALQFLVKTPAATTAGKKAIILLHGVGSNEQALFKFAEYLPGFVVISPRGPFTLGEGRHAWYQVDFSSGKPVINSAQEQESRRLLIQFIGQVKAAYNIQELYLGGFSQGGIMSYSVGLTNPRIVNGLVILSSRLLQETRPLITRSQQLGSQNIFLSHGLQDNMLPVTYAREAKEYLQQLGVNLQYQEYAMGHQVTEQVINDMVAWLTTQTGLKF